jgi:hypothetical protein
MIHNDSFDHISLGGVFGKFDSNMTGHLIEVDIGILFDIEKSEESFNEILSPFSKITNIFRSETKVMS